MGCIISAIHDDLDEWHNLCKKHGLPSDDDCYGRRAGLVKAADRLGFHGGTLRRYVETAAKADALRKEAEELMKPFEKAAEALAAIK